MGSDDLFRKRQAAKPRKLSRNPPKTSPKKIILITCDDTISAPSYFKSLVTDLGLNTQSKVEVIFDDKKKTLAPLNLVRRAQRLFEDKCSEGTHYDVVYCVFDKDSFTCYDKALAYVQKTKLADSEFIAINSVPCYEFWLLLHFQNTTSPFRRTGNKSPAENVIVQLKRQVGFEEYDKGKTDAFAVTKSFLNTAINRAKVIDSQITVNGDNPSTKIFKLAEDLLNELNELNKK